MILLEYIEKHINRKVCIIKSIFENKNRLVTISFLEEKMHISKTTIMKDIDDLKDILNRNNINFVVKKNEVCILNFNIDIKDIQHLIYEQSDFLSVMKTLLIKEKFKNKFNHSSKLCYSRAKFYSLKKRVNEFFEIVGLNNNLIKRILFISWLECEMGIQCVPLYIKNIYEERFKKIIDKMRYLTNSEKKKFNVILQTFFIFDLKQIEIPANMFFLEFCLYDIDQRIIEEFNEFWKSDLSIKSSSATFFYKLLSSNFLMPVFLPKEYIDNLLNNPYIYKLLLNLEKTFSIELCINYKFLGVFFNFIKYRCLDVLDFFVPNEAITTLLGESVYLKVKNVFEKVGMNTDDGSLRYLSNRILSFILEKNDRIKIYIYSDSLLDFYEIYYFLKQNIKIDVELIDVWLNKPNQLVSIEGNKRIVILDCDSLNNRIALKAETFLLRKPFTLQKIEKLSNCILKMKYNDLSNNIHLG